VPNNWLKAGEKANASFVGACGPGYTVSVQ
jgi:hypothetical protein